MRGAQLDHFTGADEQDMLLRDFVEDPLRQSDCGSGHRHAVSADLGRAAHFLCNRKGALKHLMQIGAKSAGLGSLSHRFLHLPQYLGLSEHHRVQAGGHAKRMAHGIDQQKQKKKKTQFGKWQLVIIGQKMRSGIDGALHVAMQVAGCIQLGAVASGEDRGFVITGCSRAPIEPRARRRYRATKLIGGKGNLFAKRYGCGSMVEANGKQLHSARSQASNERLYYSLLLTRMRGEGVGLNDSAHKFPNWIPWCFLGVVANLSSCLRQKPKNAGFRRPIAPADFFNYRPALIGSHFPDVTAICCARAKHACPWCARALRYRGPIRLPECKRAIAACRCSERTAAPDRIPFA